MTCDHARMLMSERLDNRLDAATIAALDTHMAGCPACREHWQTLQRVASLFAGADLAAPAPGFTSRVMAKLERAEQRRQSPFRRWAAVVAPLGAAALLALVFVAALASQPAVDVPAAASLPVVRLIGAIANSGVLSALVANGESSAQAVWSVASALPASLVLLALLWLALGTVALSYVLARVILAYEPVAIMVRR